MLVTCKQYEPGVEKYFDEQCKVNPHQTPFPIFFLRPYIRDILYSQDTSTRRGECRPSIRSCVQ